MSGLYPQLRNICRQLELFVVGELPPDQYVDQRLAVVAQWHSPQDLQCAENILLYLPLGATNILVAHPDWELLTDDYPLCLLEILGTLLDGEFLNARTVV